MCAECTLNCAAETREMSSFDMFRCQRYSATNNVTQTIHHFFSTRRRRRQSLLTHGGVGKAQEGGGGDIPE